VHCSSLPRRVTTARRAARAAKAAVNLQLQAAANPAALAAPAPPTQGPPAGCGLPSRIHGPGLFRCGSVRGRRPFPLSSSSSRCWLSTRPCCPSKRHSRSPTPSHQLCGPCSASGSAGSGHAHMVRDRKGKKEREKGMDAQTPVTHEEDCR
jgi:hypothetical protein